MNGTKARAIRRKVMPFPTPVELREYHKMKNGSLKVFGFRKAYKDAKKANRTK